VHVKKHREFQAGVVLIALAESFSPSTAQRPLADVPTCFNTALRRVAVLPAVTCAFPVTLTSNSQSVCLFFLFSPRES